MKAIKFFFLIIVSVVIATAIYFSWASVSDFVSNPSTSSGTNVGGLPASSDRTATNNTVQGGDSLLKVLSENAVFDYWVALKGSTSTGSVNKNTELFYLSDEGRVIKIDGNPS